MFEERLAAGHSVFHRLDPRVKIIMAFLFSVVVAVADNISVLWIALAVSAAMAAVARLPLGGLAPRLLIVNSFVLFLWFFLPFSTPGEPLFDIGSLTVTREGVAFSLAITVKSNAIILANIALLSTSTIFSLVHGMSHMYVPEKLIHLFFFSFRYAYVLQKEYMRLTCAMKVRCFTPGTNMHTYRSYAYLAGMLLVNSYDRSERVYDAMKCRGFKGEYRVLKHFHLKAADVATAIVLFVIVFILAYMEWGL